MNAAIVGTSVLAVAASDVRPTVGETVRLFAAWDGGWPAEIAWEGVDADAGLEAAVTPRAPGPLVVRAGEASITLDVQPADNVGSNVIRPEVRPLPDVPATACRDDRYPSLAGAWIAWCSPTGRVDRATDLVTRATASLSAAVEAPGLGPAAILAGIRGLFRLPDPLPVAEAVRVADPPIGPPATDGTHAAFAWADRVEAFDVTDVVRPRTDARPLLGQPVAIAWPWAAWVEDGGVTGEDIWARAEDGRRFPLARAPRSERLVVGQDRWIAWTDEEGVYVQDMGRGERRVYAADTGFQHAPSLWGPVACWEDRGALRAGAGDIDLLCSDGLELRRAGHQRAPARWGPWLLFREGERTWVATAPFLVLDDDDPRAEPGGATIAGGWRGARRDGPVTWTFDWPAPRWRVERWDGAAWAPGEPLGVGRVAVTHPGGDAIRLVPEAP